MANISVREIGVALDINAGFRENQLLAAGTITELPVADYAGLGDMGTDALGNRFKQDMRENTFRAAGGRQVAIRINGVDFYTEATIGIPGTFGAAIGVCTADGTRYCIKRQLAAVNDTDRQKSIIKEAIIGHTLFQKTSTAAFNTGPACLKVYYIVKGSQRVLIRRRNGTYEAGADGRPQPYFVYYMLMERGNITLDEYLDGRWDPTHTYRLPGGRPENFRTYVKRLANWMVRLSVPEINFVHGDCKSNNILLDANNHLRMIDYGWSQINVNNVLLKGLTNIQHTNWRDFTLLATDIRLHNPSTMGYFVMNADGTRNYINRELVQRILEGATSRGRADLWTRNLDWANSYMFLDNNTARNPNGEAQYVYDFLHRRGVVTEASVAADIPPNPFAAPVAAAVAPGAGAAAAAVVARPLLQIATGRNYENPIRAMNVAYVGNMATAMDGWVQARGARPDPRQQVMDWANLFLAPGSAISITAEDDGTLEEYLNAANQVMMDMAAGRDRRAALTRLETVMQTIRDRFLNAAEADRQPPGAARAAVAGLGGPGAAPLNAAAALNAARPAAAVAAARAARGAAVPARQPAGPALIDLLAGPAADANVAAGAAAFAALQRARAAVAAPGVANERFFQLGQAAAQAERDAQAARDRQAQAERDRQAQAERDRLAQAERDRQAQAERDRQAQAEQDRLAQAERDRLAREAADAAAAAAAWPYDPYWRQGPFDAAAYAAAAAAAAAPAAAAPANRWPLGHAGRRRARRPAQAVVQVQPAVRGRDRCDLAVDIAATGAAVGIVGVAGYAAYAVGAAAYPVLAAIPGLGWGALGVVGLIGLTRGCGQGGGSQKTRKNRKTRQSGGRAATMRATNNGLLSMKNAIVPSKSPVMKTAPQAKTLLSVENKVAPMTKVDFDYQPTYDYERFLNSSVHLLFHYLRFDAMPSVSEKDKKDLLKKLSYVQCRYPTILKDILAFAEKEDLEGLLDLAEKNKVNMEGLIEEAKLYLPKGDEVVLLKKAETIIDGWFAESNPMLAYGLFRRLSFAIQSDESLEGFVKEYLELPIEDRKEKTIYQMHNAFVV